MAHSQNAISNTFGDNGQIIQGDLVNNNGGLFVSDGASFNFSLASFISAQPYSNPRDGCLQSLAFLAMYDRSNDIDVAAEGTCEWLPAHDTFKKWKSYHHSILWIEGLPGSGKSTLLRYIVDHAKTHLNLEENDITLKFFFHGRGGELQKNISGFFRSILHQILCKIPTVLPDLVASFEDRVKKLGKPGDGWHWHETELQGFFRSSLIKLLEHHNIWLFVDALDESGRKSAISLIEEFELLLGEVSSSHLSLHICFTCRPYPILNFNSELRLCLDKENREDIVTYVRAQFPYSSPLAKSEIPSMIKERANGIFMWARIAVNKAKQLHDEGETPGRIKDKINSLPEELNDLYGEIVQSMDDPQTSLRLIEWVCFAMRPLSLKELRWAMAVRDDGSCKSLEECKNGDLIDNDESMERQIKVLSRGLVEVVLSSNKRIAQFIHQSVKDFFVGYGLITLNGKEGFPLKAIAEIAHRRLSKSCIRYIAIEEFAQFSRLNKDEWRRTQRKRLRSFPLLKYATRFWVKHAAKSEESGESQDDILQLFSWPSDALLQLWIQIYRTLSPHSSYSLTLRSNMVHIVSLYGLAGSLRSLLQRDKLSKTMIDARDGLRRTPLWLAARNGHLTVAKQLLDTGKVDINARDLSGYWGIRIAENSKPASIKITLLLYMIHYLGDGIWDQTPLSIAAKNGHEHIVKLLLDGGGAHINAKDQVGQTPLSIAAKNGEAAVVQSLIDSGKVAVAQNMSHLFMNFEELLSSVDKVDVNTRCQNGKTPLSYAAEEGHMAIIRMLLQAAKVNIDTAAQSGRTPLSYAAENGHEEIVSLLLKNEVNVNAKTWSGRTPLSYAAEKGHAGVIRLLLGADKVDADAKTWSGHTPLSYAAYGGSDIISLLLDKGSVNANIKLKTGLTLLSYASIHGRGDIVEKLLATGKVNVNAKCKHGLTSLSYASRHGHGDIVEKLLAINKIDVNAGDRFGSTPLSYAVEKGYENIVEKLLATGKIDVNIRDWAGCTPFLYAVKKGYENIVEKLLATGKIDVDVRDQAGRTPFSYATEEGHENIVEKLLATGKIDVSVRDRNGRTPFSYAVGGDYSAVTKMLFETTKVDLGEKAENGQSLLSFAVTGNNIDAINLLLSADKVDVDARDKNGQTPLLLATKTKRTSLIEALLRLGGANINMIDNEGRTPLSVAAERGCVPVMQLLLQSDKLEVDMRDRKGRTPLSFAAGEAHVDAIKLLLESGKADIGAKDNKGRSPLWWARNGARTWARKWARKLARKWDSDLDSESDREWGVEGARRRAKTKQRQAAVEMLSRWARNPGFLSDPEPSSDAQSHSDTDGDKTDWSD
ncbi:Ankyrin-R-like protein [Cladobotryum mycophilum]|uniref:Ankyrin-R-like protein n=1 Tax=Cladobotryum mycophilum TaxID=491253 RepID=A0ABR0SG59_9HYPO